MAIAASDPEGDPLLYELVVGPRALVLSSDGVAPRLFWVPTQRDIGPWFVRVQVTEQRDRGKKANVDFLFDVREATSCEAVSCTVNTGCTASLAPLELRCCDNAQGDVPHRVAELPCPQGRGLWIGRNLNEGFGTVDQCDRFRVINFGQIGATVRLNVAVRCLDASEPIVISARMRTVERELFNAPRVITRMHEDEDGFARRFGIAFPVRGPGPFFEFEDAEAELYVAAQDVAGQKLERRIRLRLTFEEIPDLPDAPLVRPPWAASAPE